MPQLALETFFNQYIWLLIVLFGFYYFTITVVLPNISLLVKSRDKLSKIENTLTTHLESPLHKNENVISSLNFIESKNLYKNKNI